MEAEVEVALAEMRERDGHGSSVRLSPGGALDKTPDDSAPVEDFTLEATIETR